MAKSQRRLDRYMKCMKACKYEECNSQELLGQLQPNAKVRVKSDFASDDTAQATVTKGMTGRVLRVDSEGDAYIKFWHHEYDEEVFKHWVFRSRSSGSSPLFA